MHTLAHAGECIHAHWAILIEEAALRLNTSGYLQSIDVCLKTKTRLTVNITIVHIMLIDLLYTAELQINTLYNCERRSLYSDGMNWKYM